MNKFLVSISWFCYVFLLAAPLNAQVYFFQEAEKSFKSGEYADALVQNANALRKFRASAEEDSLVVGYVQRAQISWDAIGIKQALLLSDSAIYLSRSDQVDIENKIKALNLKGQLLVHSTRYDQARGFFQQAENLITTALMESPTVAALYNNISWLHLNRQDLENAYGYAQKSLSIQKKNYGEDDRRLMGVYQSLGLIANDLARYAEAESYSQSLLTLAQKHLDPDHPTMALVHNQLSIVYETQFKFQQALQEMLVMEAISHKAYKKTGNPQYLAIAYNNIGNLYNKIHEFTLAEPYFEKALELHTHNFGEDDLGIVQALTHVASNKLFLKKFAEADSLFQRAYAIQKSLEKENIRGLADLESQLGDLYAFQDRQEESKTWYRLALGHYKEAGIKDSYLYIETLNSLGNSLIATGDYSQGIALHQEALELFRWRYPEEKIAIAGKLNRVAEAYLLAGKIDQGLMYSDSVFLEIVPKAPLHHIATWTAQLPPHAWIADYILTRIRLISQAESKNLANYQQILQLVKGYLDNFEKSVLGMRTQASLIELAKKQKDILEEGTHAAWILANHFDQKEELETAFSFAERGKAVLLRLAANNASLDAEQENWSPLMKEDHRHRVELNALTTVYLNADTTKQEQLVNLTQKLEEYQLFQDSAKKLGLPEWSRKTAMDPKSLAEIQNQLRNLGHDLLEFVVTEEQVYGFLVTPDNYQVYQVPRESIDTEIKALSQLDRINPMVFRDAAHTLYMSLLAPIRTKLKAEKLLIVPDGELFGINFEILVTSQKGNKFSEFDYLIREIEISYLLSASSAGIGATLKSKSGKPLFFAPGFTEEMKASYQATANSRSDPTPIQARLVRQPFSLQTASKASQLFGGLLFAEHSAQESEFYKKASSASILHLSTHGQADHQSPIHSRLYLAYPDTTQDESATDGILHAYEIYGMDIQAELAILSACNTGTGVYSGGEGVISLAHSFLFAGATSVVMSMWSIDEKTNAQILSAFFEKLKDGKSKSQALREAKLEFINEVPEELANPYYWAGLGLIGDPRPIDSQRPVWIYLLLLLIAGAIIYFRIRRSRS
ncbi:CHAT domain-containing protein [Algoriphagus litoralis]|uniref:CHAT domain-containing protein n=1 Tax=Algoriphagus litoralis TaxID=2202829 RepID=UPI0018E558A2|nr:CHAT domain-containing tetratricopeptide repeat protein [Algoriphagus litoralis]